MKYCTYLNKVRFYEKLIHTLEVFKCALNERCLDFWTQLLAMTGAITDDDITYGTGAQLRRLLILKFR